MKADYIWMLIEKQKEDIVSLKNTQERVERIIKIIDNAPVPPDTPLNFVFLETMDIESDILSNALKRYRLGGRDLISPDEFYETDVENVTAVLEKIYDLCENKITSNGSKL